MKHFKNLRKLEQWVISISFLIALVMLLYWWILKVSNSKLWILFIFVIVPLIQFLITPIFTQLNYYRYFLPMVVSFGNSKSVIDLHNGTSFDYLLKMTKTKKGLKWKKQMLYFYLSALMNIIHQIENGTLPKGVIIRGSSYFLSKNSAEKLGFSVRKTSLFEQLNVLLNYLDLIWMYSFSNGKLTLPNLKNISTVRTTGSQLLKRKDKINTLLKKLN